MKKLTVIIAAILIIPVLAAGCSELGLKASAAGQTALPALAPPSGVTASFEVCGTFERTSASSVSEQSKGETYYVFHGDLEGQFVTTTKVEGVMIEGGTFALTKGTFFELEDAEDSGVPRVKF